MNGIKDTSQQHTWAFLGDSEMDEPIPRHAPARRPAAGLDNLTFVINCNLAASRRPGAGSSEQDHPRLEAFFQGAGWNVIKVIWGRGWDQLLAQQNALIFLMNETWTATTRPSARALLRRDPHQGNGRLDRRPALGTPSAARPRLPQGRGLQGSR